MKIWLVRVASAVIALCSGTLSFASIYATVQRANFLGNWWFAITLIVHIASLLGMCFASLAWLFGKTWARKILVQMALLDLLGFTLLMGSFVIAGSSVSDLVEFTVSSPSNLVGFVVLPAVVLTVFSTRWLLEK